MQPLESISVIKNTPKIARTIRAPENANVEISHQAVEKHAHQSKSVNPNTKKYTMYNQYDRKPKKNTQEQESLLFRSTMFTYLTHSQALIESGEVDAASEHLEQLMIGFNFSDANSVVIEMYRLLNYVHNDIRINGLSEESRRHNLAGIIRNLKEGFGEE
jgi:hypothetical protein